VDVVGSVGCAAEGVVLREGAQAASNTLRNRSSHDLVTGTDYSLPAA